MATIKSTLRTSAHHALTNALRNNKKNKIKFSYTLIIFLYYVFFVNFKTKKRNLSHLNLNLTQQKDVLI